MIDVLDIIKQSEDERVNVHPNIITYRELQKRVLDMVDQELNRLVKEKIIKHGKTINDRWIATNNIKQ